MKHFLLTGLFAAATLGMTAVVPEAAPSLVKAADQVKETNVKAGTTRARILSPGVTMTTGSGVKKIHTLAGAKKSVISQPRRAKSVAKAPEGFTLFESFEAWDGEDNNWTPEGWTVDMRGEVERAGSWTPAEANPMLPAPSDGNYYYGINFSSSKQDEWLITPQFAVTEGDILSYYLYLDPAFLFSLDNVDWETYEFIGDKVVAATLQIWAQPEGGEWVMLHDYVDDYDGLGLMDMLMLTPAELEKKTIALDSFIGKNIKVAFRYVGTDGNTMFIDAVGVGKPELDDISYMDPFSTLYWGFERGYELIGLTADIAQHPVYTPLTWTNMSYHEGATYTWTYCDPVTAEFVTSDEPDALTVTYVPDYSSPASMRNNFFYPPTLTGSAPGASPGSFSAPYVYFQAGGKCERTLADGTEFEASLLPFAFNNLDVTFTTVDDATIGDLSIPVFGHNMHTDEYWLNYSLNGEEKIEGDYSRLEGIANLFFASPAPLVVNGMNVWGYGHILPDAELTATIYAVNSEMSTDISTFTTIATTTIKGSDVIAQYPDANGFLCLPFDFATPGVVQATDEHPAFFFMLTGFNSDQVEYFAPLQSKEPDPNYMCLGYILNHIDLSNHVERDPYYSLKNMVYKENGEYVDLYGSFAIGINGEYPWLDTECEEIKLPADGSELTVALGSYHDGAKLTVEAPEGMTAKVNGRYNECKLTVAHVDASKVIDDNLVVKGPGVELAIPVKGKLDGVAGITAAGATLTGMYDLSGRAVNAETAPAGVYILKYSDGSVRKTTVKK